MRNLVLASCFVFALSIGTALGSGGGDGTDKHHHHKKGDRLGLDEKQKEQFSTFRKEMKALRGEKRTLAREFDKAIQRGASNDEISNLHGKIQGIKKQIADIRLKKLLLLKPDQRKKFHAKKGKRRGKRGARHHHHDSDEAI